MGLAQLKAAMLFTLVLLFGTVAAIFGLILWYSGAKLSTTAGLALVVVFTLAMTLLQWWFGPVVIKYFTRMREINKTEPEYRWIHEMVEKIAAKAKVPKPRVYLVQDGTPNAFAFGRTPSSSNLAINTGLLNLLNKDEIEAVIAHEIGHIKHWDVTVITMASMVPFLIYYGVILLASQSRSHDDRGGATAPILVILGAYLAQFISSLLVMYLSRTRESYADAFSAVITGKPENLRTGLAKITYGGFPSGTNTTNYASTRALYIADPINSTELAKELEKSARKKEKEGPIRIPKIELDHAIEWEKNRRWMQWFSTHPFTYKRIAALNELEKEIKTGRISLEAV